MENQSTTLSMEYKVDFNNDNGKHKPKKQITISKNTPPKIPRIAKLLALAHHLQDLLDKGVVQDYADIARLSGLSRARVTQIMNLTLLAPQIQEEILAQKANFSVGQLIQMIATNPIWKEQMKIWGLKKSTGPFADKTGNRIFD